MPVLAIETSTSSTKALLYDRDKGVLASSRESYGILHQKGQTDTEAVFALAMKNAERIARGKDVEAIALCGTWHSICGLDNNGSPVTPTYSWDYMDSANYAESLRRDPSLSEAFYRRTGCMPHNTYPSYTLGYLRTQGLDCHPGRIQLLPPDGLPPGKPQHTKRQRPGKSGNNGL